MIHILIKSFFRYLLVASFFLSTTLWAHSNRDKVRLNIPIVKIALSTYDYPYYYNRPYYYSNGNYYYGGTYRNGIYRYGKRKYSKGHYYKRGYRYHRGKRYRARNGYYGYFKNRQNFIKHRKYRKKIRYLNDNVRKSKKRYDRAVKRKRNFKNIHERRRRN